MLNSYTSPMKNLNLFLLFSSILLANPEGEKIAKRLDKASQGYVGERTTMQMVLFDAYGETIERELEGKGMELANGDKSISIFLSPADVKGTKLLNWEQKQGSDNQWLYLPSLRRVKRISSRNKSSSYMGSEFTYEDLESQSIEKFTHDLIKTKQDAKLGTIWVIEKKKKGRSAYQKIITEISEKYNAAIRTEYYDRKGELLKVATLSGYKAYEVNGKTFYRPSMIEMQNKQNKKKSVIKWKKQELGVSLRESDFDKEALK